MTTSTWDSPAPLMHTAPVARVRAATSREVDSAPSVMNPFARRPQGEPLSSRERIGIAIMVISMTALVWVALLVRV